MRILKTSLLAIALSMPIFSFPSLANAQSSIEKAFIAKSRLSSSIWKKHDPSSNIVVDHSAWDAFLSKYTRKNAQGINLVAYGSVSAADKKSLQDYLASLQATDVTKLNRNEQYAFWLNLYNASTVNLGIKNFPVDSILDIKSNPLDLKGPFNDNVAKVNGKKLTLDTIESGIVRPIWNDPRLHYAFNCAAISCPNLGSKAYKGTKINAQLNAAAKAYVNDPRGIRINNGKITASKIYFWYSGDFGKDEKAVLAHIKKFASPKLKAGLEGKTKIDSYEYDWALNKK
jgi:hypothetical protein